jgi:hypothetical protein
MTGPAAAAPFPCVSRPASRRVARSPPGAPCRRTGSRCYPAAHGSPSLPEALVARACARPPRPPLAPDAAHVSRAHAARVPGEDRRRRWRPPLHLSRGRRARVPPRERAPPRRRAEGRPRRGALAERGRGPRGALRRTADRRGARRDQRPSLSRRGRDDRPAQRRARARRGRRARGPRGVGPPGRRSLPRGLDGRGPRARAGVGRDRLRAVPRDRLARAVRARRGRRGPDHQHQLHQRDDRPAEGRHVHAPRRVPERARRDRGDGAPAGERLSLDPSDVPLQRLVLHLGGHRGRRAPRGHPEGRAGARLRARRGGAGEPSLRRADGARDAAVPPPPPPRRRR